MDPVDFDTRAFEAIQARMVEVWPDLTMRRGTAERTLVVISSVTFDLPEHFQPLMPSYEERYLTLVLALATQPGTTVIYVTSQPILPRLLDYYLDLIPSVDRAQMRKRLIPVSVGDPRLRPLSAKILERPHLLARIRSLVKDPNRAVILPFITTPLEAQLAVELGIPIYGTDPRLSHLGSKSGSRQVFLAADVPHPRGAEDLNSVDQIEDVLEELVRTPQPPTGAVVKLDEGVGGMGNAIVDLRGASVDELADRVRRLEPEDNAYDSEQFLAAFCEKGGIVEERITGLEVRSPSVQLRVSPEGPFEILTTHDQVLGGAFGHTYLGCRFPAAPEYAGLITAHASAIAHEMGKRGVVGRFAIDFVVNRADDGDWGANAVEINLRNGGTTHPYLALLALTEGTYDPATATFAVDGQPKHYVASDHISAERLDRLTPDDVLDIIDACGLGWNEETMTGSVFHLLSGVGVAGIVGVTAIDNTPAGAAGIFKRVEQTLATEARREGLPESAPL